MMYLTVRTPSNNDALTEAVFAIAVGIGIVIVAVLAILILLTIVDAIFGGNDFDEW